MKLLLPREIPSPDYRHWCASAVSLLLPVISAERLLQPVGFFEAEGVASGETAGWRRSNVGAQVGASRLAPQRPLEEVGGGGKCYFSQSEMMGVWKADVDVGAVEVGAGTEGGFDMWGRNGGSSISILCQAFSYVIH